MPASTRCAPTDVDAGSVAGSDASGAAALGGESAAFVSAEEDGTAGAISFDDANGSVALDDLGGGDPAAFSEPETFDDADAFGDPDAFEEPEIPAITEAADFG